eukprot:13923904-Alexandrium_andersonii.AAC.1
MTSQIPNRAMTPVAVAAKVLTTSLCFRLVCMCAAIASRHWPATARRRGGWSSHSASSKV